MNEAGIMLPRSDEEKRKIALQAIVGLLDIGMQHVVDKMVGEDATIEVKASASIGLIEGTLRALNILGIEPGEVLEALEILH